MFPLSFYEVYIPNTTKDVKRHINKMLRYQLRNQGKGDYKFTPLSWGYSEGRQFPYGTIEKENRCKGLTVVVGVSISRQLQLAEVQ